MPTTTDMTDITNHIRRLSTPFKFFRSPRRSLCASHFSLPLLSLSLMRRNPISQQHSLNTSGRLENRHPGLRSLALRPSLNSSSSQRAESFGA